jgi:multisubunit Na+/H+ antiporter MnhG subunit
MGAQIAVDVLLAAAVALVLVCALGVALMHDLYAKLHYVTPIAVVAPVLVAIAVTVREGFSENTVQTWMTVGLLVIAGPFLSHATIRAARIRQCGDWRGPQSRGADPDEGET